MTHICNNCKHQEICKEKFKEKTGLLCKNIFYRKQKEKDLEYILNCYEEIHQKLLKDLINGNQKEKIKGLSEELQ